MGHGALGWPGAASRLLVPHRMLVRAAVFYPLGLELQQGTPTHAEMGQG